VKGNGRQAPLHSLINARQVLIRHRAGIMRAATSFIVQMQPQPQQRGAASDTAECMTNWLENARETWL